MLSVLWKIIAPPPLQTSSKQVTGKYMRVFLGDSCYHTINRKTHFGCQLSLISPWSLTRAFFSPSFFFLNACWAGLKIKPSNEKAAYWLTTETKLIVWGVGFILDYGYFKSKYMDLNKQGNNPQLGVMCGGLGLYQLQNFNDRCGSSLWQGSVLQTHLS